MKVYECLKIFFVSTFLMRIADICIVMLYHFKHAKLAKKWHTAKFKVVFCSHKSFMQWLLQSVRYAGTVWTMKQRARFGRAASHFGALQQEARAVLQRCGKEINMASFV